MVEVAQRGQRVLDDVVARLAAHGGHEGHPAGVVLVRTVVEAGGGGSSGEPAERRDQWATSSRQVTARSDAARASSRAGEGVQPPQGRRWPAWVLRQCIGRSGVPGTGDAHPDRGSDQGDHAAAPDVNGGRRRGPRGADRGRTHPRRSRRPPQPGPRRPPVPHHGRGACASRRATVPSRPGRRRQRLSAPARRRPEAEDVVLAARPEAEREDQVDEGAETHERSLSSR